MLFHKINYKRIFSAIPGRCHFASSFGGRSLRDVLSTKIHDEQKLVKEFRSKYGKINVGVITVDHIYSGMRGMLSMICETSELYPDKGILYRGYSIGEVRQCLPKPTGANEPYVEGVLWLLLTGDIPTKAQCDTLAADLAERHNIPKEVDAIIKSLPKSMHPMSQFSIAMTAMSDHSKFKKAYQGGLKKTQYWKYVYEDGLDLIAKAPIVAGKIYRNTFKQDKSELEISQTADLAYNFGKLLNQDGEQFDAFVDFIRLYLLLHCDHEGGNVSAHTVHLVGSALSDPYLSFAAGMNGLAGPLHGLATQECLIWLKQLMAKVGDKPTDEQLRDFVSQTLNEGKVVPGYGHAVLRQTDPRFIAQMEFAKNNCSNALPIELTRRLFEIVPDILKKTGKVSNPWPNVDAHSGVLLEYYGIKEIEFFTVMFGVSRAIGVMANAIWSRAMGYPIERPKSITTFNLRQAVEIGLKMQDQLKKQNLKAPQ